jgi:3-(3-hydroxy-phenyl)propionate hydroxylase
MVNLQQYYLEEYLLTRAAALPSLEIRWKNKVTALQPPTASPSKSHLQVETPDGSYGVSADWVLVADGARSPLRRMLGLDIEGKVFQDRFLIADVVMKADFPAERWFWFDPPFHRNQSVLLRPITYGASTFSLAGMSIPRKRKSPKTLFRVSRRCWVPIMHSTSNG